jgi:hypothetical protein
MLVRCDGFQEIQPSSAWRCRGRGTTLPHNRRLLRALWRIAVIVGWGLLCVALAPGLR